MRSSSALRKYSSSFVPVFGADVNILDRGSSVRLERAG